MSRPRAIVAVVVGSLGVPVWVGLVAVVWWVVPPVGAGAARTAATIRASVAGVEERLGTLDDALRQTAVTLAAFRAEREDDPESVLAQRRRLDAELAPVLTQIREDLTAVHDVVVSIDRLLETLDLPFLRTSRRARAERADAVRERLPVFDPEVRGPGLELAPLRRVVGEAREQVALWRASLEALDADLSALEARAPRLALFLCLAVTLLGLWSLVGQVCLVQAGIRGLRRAAP